MRSSRLLFTAAALLSAVAACSSSTSSNDQVPQPTRIDPNVGYATTTVPVLITGTGFLAKAQQPSGGESPVLDTTHRAWLGNVELANVTWIDPQTLRAMVPAGVAVGNYDLTVENALGDRGTLKNAYTVQPTPGFSGPLTVTPPPWMIEGAGEP